MKDFLKDPRPKPTYRMIALKKLKAQSSVKSTLHHHTGG